MKKVPEMEEPLNSSERFMAHVSYRLEFMIEQNRAIIEQNNSIIDHLAKQGSVAVEEAKTEVAKPAPKKKSAKRV